MSTELGLEPSDPLNLLLHNTAQNDESSDDSNSEGAGPQDWSKFSSMWSDQPHSALKSYPDLMDFADLGMDLDYASLGIEPSALQLNPGFNLSFDENSLSSTSFNDVYPQFSFQYPTAQEMDFSASPETFTKERRLSITSSSSSGASFSPVPESMSSPASDGSSHKEEPSEQATTFANDPAAELAHRVRQTAGVMLAVPMNGFPPVPTAQGKLPIPRLARHDSPGSSNVSTSSSAASTPPPSTPPSSNASPLSINVNGVLSTNTPSIPTPTGAAPATSLPRPKTSHTTIERRYRTNLNARIQSLRMAVPALRVLEDKEGGGKKIKKNVKGGVVVKGTGIGIIESEDGSVVDVIDERGFVDGVKVARKCSKANVLGKAVEYIRVLKKREQRLKAEQAGLKTLVSGLVGGPALVREWEKEWRAKFGGEEKDEVEGDEEDGDDDDSEDEDGEDGDEEAGKKRKRPKLSASAPKKPIEKKEKKPAAPPVLSTDGSGNTVPEKRKRGRPRKILPPPVVLNSISADIKQDEVMHPPTPGQWAQQQQSQPQQYLLAVFALFSFFNSPLTSSSNMGNNYHHHAGKVLSAAHPPLAYAPEIVSQFVAPTSAAWAWKEYVQLFHLIVSLLILGSFVANWFGLSVGVGKAVARGRGMSIRTLRRTRSAARAVGAAGWLKLGEESVLEGDASSLSYFERFQISRSLSSQRNTSVNELVTAAIAIGTSNSVLGGLARIKARSLWVAAEQLTKKTQHNVSERLVLQSVDLADAASRLGSASPKVRSDGVRSYTPLQVLGCLVVKERVKEHLASLFVEAVGAQEVVKEDAEWRKTIDAARELGGHIEELGKMLERVWKSTDASSIDDSELALDAAADFEADVDGEVKALLAALVLYRRLFGDAETECLSSSTSTLLSPPPSPTPTAKRSKKHARMLLSLRKALGNRVFEDAEEEGLEDARDRVVDLIVDAERRERGASPPS